MFQSVRSKIVLVIVAVIILVVALVLYANNRSAQTQQPAATATPTPRALATPRYVGELPSGETVTATPKTTVTPRPIGPVGSTITPIAVARGSRTPIASRTPTPAASKPVVIGDLDWSRQTPLPDIKIDAATQAQLDKIKENPDPCVLTGISNSWSNPFEKTVCGMVRFINDQVIVPLLEMDCQMYGTYLARNYSSNITSSIVNGDCIITDRK